MPLAVTDIDTLQQYIGGVMARADHHANNVEDVCLAVAGGIIWRKDTGTTIEVMAHGDDMKNALWVFIGGQRYAFSYNHDAQAIEIKVGTTRGEVLQSFTGAMSLREVKQFFERL